MPEHFDKLSATPKRPLKVFLCHAHSDKDAVKALYTHLANDGVDAWLDKEKLLPGQDWELEIRKAVREADVVVVCLSKQFNQAGFRQKEVRLALDTAMEKPEGEIFIIPARLEECDNLESLRKWHWVDLFEEDGYKMLLRALRRRADNIGATLQIKKNWLPNISSSQQSQKANLKPQRVSQFETYERTDEVKKPKQKLTVKKLFGNTVFLFWSIFVFGAIFLTWKPFFQKVNPTPEENPSQVVATSTYTEIVESIFTSTPEPISTHVSVLTPTPLPTEITDASSEVRCDTKLITTITLYEIPAARKILSIQGDETVSVLGSYVSEGWSLIRTKDGTQGWVNSSLLPNLGNCALQEYGLADTVIPSDEKIVLQDAFNGDTEFRFYLTSGTPEFKILDGGESVMHLGAGSVGRKIFLYLGGAQRGSETLRMVFNLNYLNNGFLSLQWGKYYPHKELRVYPKTHRYALNDVTNKTSIQLAAGNLVCGYSHSWDKSNYLEIEYKSDEDLTVVKIDDCEAISFSKIGGFKDFFYITSYDLLSIDLYYLLISSPK